MKFDQVLLAIDDNWRLLRDGQSSSIEPWSRLEGTTLVYFHFDQSQSGLIASTGKASYAGALIEKEVRAGGTIDGSIKVFVHAVRSQADSLQAFYTAVSLDSWQELENWAAKQADHCLLIPIASVLSAELKQDPSKPKKSQNSVRVSSSKAPSDKAPSYARAFSINNEIFVFASHQDRQYLGQVTLLGQDDEDIAPAVTALTKQFPTREWATVIDQLGWVTVNGRMPDGERQIASQVAQSLGLTPAMFTTQKFNDGQSSIASSLNLLSEDVLIQDKSVSGLAKLSWMSESWAAPVAAVACVVFVLAAGAGFYFQHEIGNQEQVLAQQQAQSAQLQQRVANITRENTPLLNDPQLAFTAKLTEAALYEPARMLELFKRAAGTRIRIQRVQLFVDDTSSRRSYRVEGVVANGANADIASLLATLKTAGWQASPTRSPDSSIGAFAYVFKPASSEAL